MADSKNFFENYLPKKIENNEALKAGGKTYHFRITGAGDWTLDLAEGTVKAVSEEEAEAAAEAADCVVTCAQEDWEKMLDNPRTAMQLFFAKKLKVSNMGLGQKLMQILG